MADSQPTEDPVVSISLDQTNNQSTNQSSQPIDHPVAHANGQSNGYLNGQSNGHSPNQSIDHSTNQSAELLKIKNDIVAHTMPKSNVSVPMNDHAQIRTETTNEPLPCPQRDYLYSWRIISLLYFGWLTPLLRKGAKKALQMSDLWDIYPEEKADSCISAFTIKWEEEKQRAARRTEEAAAKAASQPSNSKTPVAVVQPIKPSLVRVVVRLIGWQFLLSAIVFAYTTFDSLIGPQILKKLTEYSVKVARGDDIPDLDGYQWALYLFGSAAVAAVARSLALHTTIRLFIRVRNALIIAVYQKSLRIPLGNRNDGKVNNLMSSDTQKIVEFAGMVHNLWTAPIIIAVGVYQLWVEVNWPSLVGLAVIFSFFPLAGFMTVKQMFYQGKAAKETDSRITLVSEVIQGIRVIKLSAWVAPFLKTLDIARDRELYWLKRYAWLKSLTFGVLLLVPLMVSVVIFGAYVGTGGDMSPTIVFTTLSLVNVIRMPFTFLPIALAQLTQSIVAIRRIGDFLSLPEIDESQRIQLDHVGIEMQDAQFAWGEEVAREEDNDKKTMKKSASIDSNLKKSASVDSGLKKSTSVDSNLKSNSPEPVRNPAEIELVNGSAVPTTTAYEEEEKRDQVLQMTLATNAAPQTSGAGLVLTEKAAHTTDDMTANANVKNELVTVEKVNAPVARPPRLTNVNFNVSAGQLALVLGGVGTGKSTLLYGMLGEVEQTKGKTMIGGNIAYVPQQAFIINATFRENITFGQAFDADRYAKVVYACALTSDIELLANGDMTEIGERGINLSGGQKQRISIARAAYNQTADIVLLDDPLSAVDMHVAQHIFTHCISGMMKDRLRILVTHSMAFVDFADTILMVKETAVKDSYTTKSGTAAELRQNDKEFRSLLARYNAGLEEMEGDSESKAKRKANKANKKVVETKEDAAPKDKKADLTETEEREEGSISWPVYKRYLLAGGNPFFFVFVPLMFLLTQGAQTGSDFVLSEWSNDLGVGKHPTGVWIGIYGALIAASTLFMLFRTTAMSLFGVQASRTLHHDLSRNVLSKTMTWFDRTPSGRIINRFTKDLYMIDLLLAMMMEFAISTSLSVVGILVVIAVIVPIALALFAVLAIFYLYTAEYYRRSNRELQRLESISRTPIFTHFAETLSGTASIRALKVQDMYMQENLRRVDVNTRALYFSRAINFWLQTRLNFIGAFVLGGSAVLAVASPHIDGAVSAGNFGLLVSYALNITGLLNISVIIVSQVEAMMNSVERVDYYTVPRDQEAAEARRPELSKTVQDGSWPSQGHIKIDNLQLRYREDLDLVLKGISLDIPGGSRVGIVGRTGSGKSSMLVALFRLVEPSGGSITIDGLDLADLSLTDIRTHLSIIPQDAFLFHGSFRYNLDPHSQYEDADIWQALEYVQLKGVVERLPEKLDTLIAEAGGNLSTGQRQLLCMARALLRKPKVICLDEATASVDIETDALIQTVVRTQFAGCTVLTIAHRLNTILDYDLVVVLDRGTVAEAGPPQELMRANGLFASMLHDKDGENEA